MPYANYTSEQVAERGETIYRERIRERVDPDYHGEFVVVDIETGEYEMDRDRLIAAERLLAKRPNAVLHGLRVGYSAAHSLGGHFRERTS